MSRTIRQGVRRAALVVGSASLAALIGFNGSTGPTSGAVFTASGSLTSSAGTAATFDLPGGSATAGATSVALSWTATPGATGYTIYQCERSGADCINVLLVASVSSATLSRTVTGLTSGVNYMFTVIADLANRSVTNATFSVTTTSVTASTVTATANGQTQIDAAWTSVAGATSYTLERSTSAGFTSPTTVYTGTALLASDTGLTAGTAYYYRVTATVSGSPVTSSIVSATTDAAGAPMDPSVISVLATNLTQINLSWTTVAGANSYRVERSSTAGFAGATAVYTGTATTFNDTGLAQGSTWYYRVIATNGVQTSTSNTVNATTVAPLGTPSNIFANAASTSRIDISWSPVSGATKYELQRSTTADFASYVVAYSGPAATYQNNGLPDSTQFFFRVISSNATQASVSNTYSATTFAPLGTAAPWIKVVNTTALTVTWAAVPRTTSYVLQRSTTADFASPTAVYTGMATTKAETGLTAGTVYYYRVITNVSTTGEQTTSPAVSASTASRTWTVGTAGTNVAVDQGNGDVYVANRTDNTVSVISTANNTVSPITLAGGPSMVAVDSTTGSVFVSRNTSKDVVVINRGTTVIARTITGFPNAAIGAVTVNNATGIVYAMAAATKQIAVVAKGASAVSQTITVTGTPNFLVTNASGSLLFVAQSNGQIAVINTSTFAVSYLAGALGNAYQPAHDPVTGLTYFPDFASNKVAVVNAAGTAIDSYITIAGATALTMAEVNQKTGELYVVSSAGKLSIVPRGSSTVAREPGLSAVTVFVGTNTTTGTTYSLDRSAKIVYEIGTL